MSYMEQQMQQQMEASEYHQDEMQQNHDEMADTLFEVLPLIEETHPEIYLKFMGVYQYAKDNKVRD